MRQSRKPGDHGRYAPPGCCNYGGATITWELLPGVTPLETVCSAVLTPETQWITASFCASSGHYKE